MSFAADRLGKRDRAVAVVAALLEEGNTFCDVDVAHRSQYDPCVVEAVFMRGALHMVGQQRFMQLV
jgi:hypothetical protein